MSQLLKGSGLYGVRIIFNILSLLCSLHTNMDCSTKICFLLVCKQIFPNKNKTINII